MNIEKLKEHECRFCAKYDGQYCLLKARACALQIWNLEIAKTKKIPILWEPHPDISEAMQPETTERQIKCTHPRESRQYIGRNMLKCGICGYEFE